MNQKETELNKVLSEVRKQMEYTVLSYPERDPNGFKWGDPRYNGNCSGKVPLGFIDKFGVKSVCELFAGSGTLSDVCSDYKISYSGIDLNPNPVRDNIIAMDILDMERELPDTFYSAEMCFSHPPYPGLNHVKYAGFAWKDTIGLADRDIQNMSFEKGMQKVNIATLRTYAALQPGAYMVILVGEISANGKYYSMFSNLALPGEIFQTYVKLQHNTWSGRQNYSGKHNSRALTGHEMIAVIKKPSGYEIAYVLPRKYISDIRDSMSATWKDIVMTYAREERQFTNQQIASDLESHTKAQNNHNVGAKLRQICAILEKEGLLTHIAPATWAIAA